MSISELALAENEIVAGTLNPRLDRITSLRFPFQADGVNGAQGEPATRTEQDPL